MLLTTCTSFYIDASYSRKKSGQSKVQVWDKCRDPCADHSWNINQSRPPNGCESNLEHLLRKSTPVRAAINLISNFVVAIMNGLIMDGMEGLLQLLRFRSLRLAHLSFTNKAINPRGPKMSVWNSSESGEIPCIEKGGSHFWHDAIRHKGH